MIPFNRPHDVDDAGLRDYYVPPRTESPWTRRGPTRLLLWITFLLGVAVLVYLASGCAPAPFVPEAPHPSIERIRELAAVATVAATPVRALTLTLVPAALLAGGAVHLRCLLPPDTRATVVGYGVAELRTSARPIDGLEYDLQIAAVPCGDWTAYCALARGGAVVARVEHPLTAHGLCNEGLP